MAPIALEPSPWLHHAGGNRLCLPVAISASGEKAAVRPVCSGTARVYSSWIPGGDGTSERTIGRWLSRSGNREKVVLSTKGGHPAEPGLPRLDRESLRRDLAESLAHLNTDHVEL